MLTSVRIENFQAHEDLLIELDPRVTTIVGPSDVGKSSVVRAVRWALMNVPVSSLIRDGAKRAAVEVVADGRTVRRERGTDNVYALDGKEFRAFRTDVPDEIADVLRVEEINFQFQHDPIYWFSSTAGDVSRRLNAIVDLDIIDASMAAAAREYNKARTVAQVADERLSAAVVERDSMAWAAEADEHLAQVERLEEQATDAVKAVCELRGAVEHVAAAAERKTAARGRADGAGRVLDAAKRLGKASGEAAELQAVLKSIHVADRQRVKELPDLSGVAAAAERVREAGSAADELDRAVDLAVCRRQVWESEAELLDRHRKALDDKTEGICPICGGELDEA